MIPFEGLIFAALLLPSTQLLQLVAKSTRRKKAWIHVCYSYAYLYLQTWHTVIERKET